MYDRNYDLSLYIEDKIIPKEQKIEELIKTLSFLHYKTSYSYESDLDDIKKTYEDIKNDLVNLLNYYNELNNYLDTQTFLSPSEYLLIRNISLIYSMIDYGIKKIDIWYKLATECKKCRTCLIHNNISSDHLIVNDYNYLVSWDRSKIDKPIIDLLSFYKNYYSYLKLDDVFKLYENNNCLYEEEKCLLLIYLSIPNKLVFTNNVMDDVIKINSEITYLNEILDDANTVSLFSNNKLIIVENAYIFSRTQNKKIDNVENLESYLKNSSDTIIIFINNNEKIDSVKKIVKLIKEKGIIKEFNPLKNINSIVKNMFDDYKISDNSIDLLINRVGNSLELIYQEVEKLKIYKINDKIIQNLDYKV